MTKNLIEEKSLTDIIVSTDFEIIAGNMG